MIFICPIYFFCFFLASLFLQNDYLLILLYGFNRVDIDQEKERRLI